MLIQPTGETPFSLMRFTILRPRREIPYTAPCTFPSNCYASTTSVLPYIPLSSFICSVPKSVGSKNHTIAFSAAKLFGFFDTDKRGCKGTQQEATRWKLQLTSFPPTTGLFLLPGFSYEFPRH